MCTSNALYGTLKASGKAENCTLGLYSKQIMDKTSANEHSRDKMDHCVRMSKYMQQVKEGVYTCFALSTIS